MKKTKNRVEKFLALVLCVFMITSLLNASVFAMSDSNEGFVSQKFSSIENTAEDSTFVLVNTNVQIPDDHTPETAYISEAEESNAHPVYAASAPKIDPMIHLTQKWLNQEYGKVPGFGSVPVDGQTGWPTIYGLLRALQYELGITSLSNSFGTETSTRYAQNPLHRQDGATDKKFAILQGALWCKGYSPGYTLREVNGVVVFDEVFNANVENAVTLLKKDAGLLNPDGVVTLNVMKALLSMDSFKLLSSYGGKAQIRTMQQTLNQKYEAYIGLTACDGVYGRNTNKAIVYALQAEEGLPIGVANGNFGETTKLCCPEIPYTKNAAAARCYPGTSADAYYTESQISSFTALLQFALYVNGFGDGNANGIFDARTEQSLKDFQKKHAIPTTGKADIGTWMALFLSSGDTSRSALACDCAMILTPAKAQTLYSNGYRYVGRYLTGTYNGGISKAITREEAQILFGAGMSFFPIYQTSARSAEYFTEAQGTADAKAAIAAASALGIPRNTIVYFAVDFDATDNQIASNVIPYFKKVHEKMSEGVYRTGIYGTRNVCRQVSSLGYSCSSFVGDMSTGFSGNLGFSLPDDWAFDQFATVSLGSGDGLIEIDKNAFSGHDHGVSKLNTPVTKVTVSPATAAIKEGEKLSLTATVSPENAVEKGVMWSTSNPSVAVVTNGVVTGKKAGAATITATTISGNKTATSVVTVTAPTVVPTSVKLDKATLALTKSQSSTLKATVSPSNAANKKVTWKSSDTKIATVSTGGNVKGVASGTATITATTADGKKTATCTVTVHSYVTLKVGSTTAIQNGKKTTVDNAGTKPFKISGKTMLPLRFIGEKMGGKVKYVNDKTPIQMTYGNTTVEFKLNSKDMRIITGKSSRTVKISIAAQKKGSKTYIPLRAISEALGFDVFYQSGTEYIVVNNPKMSSSIRNGRLAEAKKTWK